VQRPRFKTHLTVQVEAPDMLVISHEHGRSIMKGELFPVLASMMDGEHSIKDMADELAGRVDPTSVLFGVSVLEEAGHLVDSEALTGGPHDTLADALGAAASDRLGRLHSAEIGVRAFGEIDPVGLRATLEGLDLAVGDSPTLEVLLTDDYLRPELLEFAAEAARQGREWVPVKPCGVQTWIGPAFGPALDPCFQCLSRRLRENGSRPGRFTVGTAAQATMNIAAMEVLKHLVRGDGSGLGEGLLVYDVLNSSLETHAVPRFAGCKSCGEAEAPARPGILLARTASVVSAENGLRVSSPDRTLDRLQRHVSPVTGIVSGIRPMHRDEFTQVYSCGYSREGSARAEVEAGWRSRSTGKGIHASQARASALCEALERYSGIWRGDEERVLASFDELGDEAIHPNACMLFSEDQYRRREELNGRNDNWNRVPLRFDPQARIDWTPVWSLTEERTRYLPSMYCYYEVPVGAELLFAGADSNGAAAGNSLEEAMLQGTLEMVERDCISIWWYNRLCRPAVDLDAFDDPYFTALKRHYESLGRDLWVLDLTNDLEVPSFTAVSVPHTASDREDLLVGFGAHLDARIAIARALTEMNQFLPRTLRGQPYPVATEPVAHAKFLRPDHDHPRRGAGDFGSSSDADVVVALRTLLSRLHARGLEVLVLDQTRPDVDLPVVKMFVPGARFLWARFASGRLFDVPVQMGWQDSPTAEGAFNSAHLAI
jgi:ribosomal protein S12 methylthiotransferase accessory factor